MSENGMVILASLLLSILQAHPSIQALYFIVGTGNQEYHTHALPFFVVLYFIFGRFHLPSLGFVYAGTFLSLLVTSPITVIGSFPDHRGLRWTTGLP